MKKIALLLALIFLVSCGRQEIKVEEKPPVPQVSQAPEIEVKAEEPEETVTAAPEEKPEEKPPAQTEEKTIAYPKPAPETTPEPEAKTLCTISVNCEKLLGKLDKVAEEKRVLIPEDGVILSAVQAEFTEGETVFDVLKRCLAENNISLEYREDLVYKSVYVEGIGGIFEKDCGAYSGWMYKVNGTPPTYGASEYKLKNGDTVEFYYSC